MEKVERIEREREVDRLKYQSIQEEQCRKNQGEIFKLWSFLKYYSNYEKLFNFFSIAATASGTGKSLLHSRKSDGRKTSPPTSRKF